MENSYNAIIMAGAVLLFVIAVSVGVYLYGKLIQTNDAILTNSEYNDRTAENYALSQFAQDTERKFTGAEVAMQIINLYEGKDYSFKKIEVRTQGTSYSFPKVNEILSKVRRRW